MLSSKRIIFIKKTPRNSSSIGKNSLIWIKRQDHFFSLKKVMKLFLCTRVKYMYECNLGLVVTPVGRSQSIHPGRQRGHLLPQSSLSSGDRGPGNRAWQRHVH